MAYVTVEFAGDTASSHRTVGVRQSIGRPDRNAGQWDVEFASHDLHHLRWNSNELFKSRQISNTRGGGRGGGFIRRMCLTLVLIPCPHSIPPWETITEPSA